VINDSAMQLRELGVDLEQEDDAVGFLGVTLEQDPETSLLEMKQTGLIKRIIEALGLDDGAKGKVTRSESKQLVKDINGDLASGAFSYSSVVGMLLYLSGHTRSDITFAVNCCARYMFCPKHSHELVALKRIGRYLKQTPDRGMVMTPQARCAKLMPIWTQILLVCMVMRNIQILPAPRVGLDSSSLLQIVLSFGKPSYRQIWLYRRWKPKP